MNHVTLKFRDIFSSTNLYYSHFTRPLLHAVYNTWLTPATACGSQSTACGIEMRRGQPWIGVNCIFEESICSQNWCYLLNRKIFFQIKLNKMISKYKTIHILLTNVHLDCRGGRVPVTGMLTGMNMSKPGMNLSKPGMNLSKPGKKHNNHVIMCTIISTCN